jgi:hypothetical protein
MKDIPERLKRIIVLENKYVESMRHSLKEDERTILRLQNKSRGLKKEIEERTELIKEYERGISEAAHIRMKLESSTKMQMDADSPTAKVIRLVKDLEQQT